MLPVDFYIAGVQHHELPKLLKTSEGLNLHSGILLDLIPEPENNDDHNIVKISFKGSMLGYVPRIFSAEVSSAIDTFGKYVHCIIIELNPSEVSWNMCKVRVIVQEREEDFGYLD